MFACPVEQAFGPVRIATGRELNCHKPTNNTWASSGHVLAVWQVYQGEMCNKVTGVTDIPRPRFPGMFTVNDNNCFYKLYFLHNHLVQCILLI